MKKALKQAITVNNKKYFYTLAKMDEKICYVECKAAKIAQEFLNEDIPALILDLPNLIIAEKEYVNKQSEVVRFRLSPEDKKFIEKRAIRKGYKSVSSFLRDLALEK